MGKRMRAVLDEHLPGESTPGELLRGLRKRDGFTLKDLEEITGIKESNLSAIENGHVEMTQYYAETFAAALGVQPTLFLYPNGKFAKDDRLLEIEHKAKLMRRHG